MVCKNATCSVKPNWCHRARAKNANYLSIKHVYLRVARGDFLERMGQQFLNYAGGAPKIYINRLGLLPDTHGLE